LSRYGKAVESLAAIWAAGKTDGFRPERPQGTISRSRELIEQGHVEKFIDMDVKFHELISRAAGENGFMR